VNEICACHLGWDGMELPYILLVSTPLRKMVEVGKFMQNSDVKVGKENLEANLIVLPIEDYDLILVMDWLVKHGARVDCKNKTVQFVRPRCDVLEFNGKRVNELKFLIARTKTQKLLN
jgi:hypothetical protein